MKNEMLGAINMNATLERRVYYQFHYTVCVQVYMYTCIFERKSHLSRFVNHASDY